MLKGKNIVLGVTGGIAAYKACDVINLLRKEGANVYVIMTKHAEEFITPLTLMTLSNNPVATDMFAKVQHFDVEHISLAKRADIFLIAPATANIIGKMATGIADDMLSTTVMATKAPVVIAPAMNENMYADEAVQENIERLKGRQKREYHFVGPRESWLACGDVGMGVMEKPKEIVEYVKKLGGR